MSHRRWPPLHRRPRLGTVLIVVLVAMVLLALSAYTFSDLMLGHRRASEGGTIRAQSDATVASAVDAMRAFLMQPQVSRQDLGGTYDNPSYFAYQPVVTDASPEFASQFSVISTVLGESSSPSTTRFGLVNESSKINLNDLVANESSTDQSTTTLKLLALPGMTADIADAILDWIDADGEKREYGAEFAEDYASLEPPRAPADGPIHSLSELLLVRGVTAELLYGVDQNRNGQVDPEEADLQAAMQSLTGTSGDDLVVGSMDLGWSAYLTCYSREHNVDPLGNYRINLNEPNLELLYEKLVAVSDADTATFIIAFRQFGTAGDVADFEEDAEEADGAPIASGALIVGGEQGAGLLQAAPVASDIPLGLQGQAQGQPSGGDNPFGDEEEVLEDVAGRTVDLSNGSSFEFESVAELFDAVVEAQFESASDEDDGESALVRSPFVVGEPNEVLDYLTVYTDRAIHGRININQAPRPVLATLAELETTVIDQIIAARESRNALEFGRSHPIWILNEEIVDLEVMREIMPLITGGGDVYSADIVASTGDGNAVRRVRVLLDATRPEVPQLVWKDMEFLGRGYSRETLMNSEPQ